MEQLLTRKDAKAQGVKAYFTGKPCLHGHVAKRATVNGSCLECVAIKKPEADKKHRQLHLEKIQEYDRNRAPRPVSKDVKAAQKRRYYLKYREQILEKNAVNRAKTKEQSKIYFQQYKRENAVKVAAWNAKRRAAKLNRTPAWLGQDDFWLMSEAYDLRDLRTKMTGIVWHVDHIYPLLGEEVSGLHVPENLQVIPASVNCSKKNTVGIPRMDIRPDGRRA